MSDHVTRAEAELIAEDAARRAVRKTFAILNVDLDDPQQVEALQRDLQFARRNRTTSERISMHLKLTIAVAALAGVGTLVWIALQSVMHIDLTAFRK